jgi:RNA polymerase sigma-70 factor (ECF subfamily)
MMTTMTTLTERDAELYRRHADELIRYATVLVGPADAPDVVTDAVLAAFGARSWRDVEHPRAYLFRSVLNTATSWKRSAGRRQRREEVVAMRPAAAPPAPDGEIDAHRALAHLSPQQRAVVYLAYWDDLTPAQIAITLGLTEGSVRKQLARARAHLRSVLTRGGTDHA